MTGQLAPTEIIQALSVRFQPWRTLVGSALLFVVIVACSPGTLAGGKPPLDGV
jgi:hypothetical protein